MKKRALSLLLLCILSVESFQNRFFKIGSLGLLSATTYKIHALAKISAARCENKHEDDTLTADDLKRYEAVKFPNDPLLHCRRRKSWIENIERREIFLRTGKSLPDPNLWGYGLNYACSEPKMCPEFDKFVKQFKIHPNVQRQLKQAHGDNTFKLQCMEPYFGTDERLPGYYIKRQEIERVINARRCKAVIEKNNLHLIDVAEKSVGQINGAWHVFCKKIETYAQAKPREISEELVKQLITFVLRTGITDWNYPFNNCAFNNDKLTFFDTEDISFNACTHLYVVKRLLRSSQYMTPEALSYLEKEIVRLEKSEEGKQTCTPIYDNSQYDSHYGIDLEKVQQEWICNYDARTGKSLKQAYQEYKEQQKIV